jgi:hypothetical protein
VTQGFTATIEGYGAVRLVLEGLKQSAQNKIVRKAVDKGIRIVARAVKDLTPTDSGLAKKSVGSVVRTYPGRIVGIAGPRKGFRQQVQQTLKGGTIRSALAGTKRSERQAKTAEIAALRWYDPVKYFHFIESGRRSDMAKGKRALASPLQVFGKSVADLPGTHPVERAWASVKDQVEGVIARAVEEGIAAAVGRAA